jgi:hypothetical protein
MEFSFSSLHGDDLRICRGDFRPVRKRESDSTVV